MKNSDILKLWILTIIVGSLCFPIFYFIAIFAIEGSNKFTPQLFLIYIAFSAVYSLILSTPSIFLLGTINVVCKKYNSSKTTYLTTFSLTQIICSIITFSFFPFKVSSEWSTFSIVCAVTYTLIGIIFWIIKISKTTLINVTPIHHPTNR